MSEFKKGNFGLNGYEPPFMKLGNIQVSEEEIETVCENLLEWSEHDNALITAQFFTDYKIGYTYFQYIKHISPQLNFIWEIVIAQLCVRWFKKLEKEECKEARSLAKKYLRLYDLYQQEIDTQKSMNIKREEVETKLRHSGATIQTEDYSQYPLDEKYKTSYEDNVNKPRSKKDSE